VIWIVPTLLGLASAVAFGLAALSHDKSRISVAALLCAYWGIANTAWLCGAMDWLPMADWLIGFFCVLISIENGAKWPVQIAAICYMRLGLHAFDYLTGHQWFVAYAHGLNATFALMLCVAGGVDGGLSVRDLWRHLLRSLLPARFTEKA